MPRILSPFNFLITVFSTIGIDLCWAQMMTVLLIYFFSSILMYAYVKELVDGDVTTAFVAALYLTSNVYLVNDREVTAIGFIEMVLLILPCLLVFTKGIKRSSYRLMVISGLLFNLTYATFPNYRTSLICLIMLGLNLFFLFVKKGLKINTCKSEATRKFINIPFDTTLLITCLKLLAIFSLSLLLSSIWVIAIIQTNMDALVAGYAGTGVPACVLNIRFFYDVIRLVAKWSFYEADLGKPYLPYSHVYVHNAFIILSSYLVPLLAFTSLLISKSRRLTVFYSGVAIIFLFLSSAFCLSSSRIYLAIVAEFPLTMVFREPAHWIFFVIMSYSILIGTTLSALFYRLGKRKRLQVVALVLVVVLFVFTSFPLTTGDVTRNWLDPGLKGSYLPSSYVQLNDMLPSQYWAIMLPLRGTYVVHNFTEGLFSCGNPYPLIFSKPIISGAGTEYVQPENPDLINKLHNEMRTNLNYKNIAPEGKARAQGVSKFLGMLGIKHLVLEKNIIFGNAYSLNELKLHENENFALVKEWDEVALFNNTYALQKLYVADNFLNYTTIDDMYKSIENSEWNTLKHSAFINATSQNEANKTLITPENFVWREVSPTKYEANAESNGSFVLVFLESYNKHWKLHINGKQVSETNHLKVNAFANGWLINETGNLTITIRYESQNLLAISVVASVILPMGLLTFLSRRDIKTVASLIQRRFERKIDQTKKGSADAK